jgi:hypothetical protein
MIHISSMDDLDSIRDNFELWRECYGFLDTLEYMVNPIFFGKILNCQPIWISDTTIIASSVNNSIVL